MCVCVCYLQVYFALQLSCAVFPEIVRKVRSFPLYDSAQHTMCHLRAFSSQMSLQWRALPCWCLKPSAVSLTWDPVTPLRSAALSSGWTTGLGSAPATPFLRLFPEQVCRPWPLLNTNPPPPPQTQPPQNCWAPALLACHRRWDILILWNSNLSVSYWPFCCMSHKLWNQSDGFWNVASICKAKPFSSTEFQWVTKPKFLFKRKSAHGHLNLCPFQRLWHQVLK